MDTISSKIIFKGLYFPPVPTIFFTAFSRADTPFIIFLTMKHRKDMKGLGEKLHGNKYSNNHGPTPVGLDSDLHPALKHQGCRAGFEHMIRGLVPVNL